LSIKYYIKGLNAAMRFPIQLICEIPADRVPSFTEDKSWKYYSAKAAFRG